MSKVTSPLLGFGAAGQIGKTQVYASWRGVPYARRYVVPSNPNTTGQQATRGVFSWLNAVWKLSSADSQAPWVGYSKGQKFTDRNAYIKKNLPGLRGQTDITAFIGSPGANGGLASSSCVSTGASGAINFVIANPTPPTGWTQTGQVVMAILAQSPATGTNYASTSNKITTSFTSQSLTDLAAGSYQWAEWPIWTKPDGTTAYGPSITGTATVS